MEIPLCTNRQADRTEIVHSCTLRGGKKLCHNMVNLMIFCSMHGFNDIPCKVWVMASVVLGSIHTCDLLGVNYCLNFSVWEIARNGYMQTIIEPFNSGNNLPNSNVNARIQYTTTHYLANSSCDSSRLLNRKCDWTLKQRVFFHHAVKPEFNNTLYNGRAVASIASNRACTSIRL